jgi:chemotaxis protein CheX
MITKANESAPSFDTFSQKNLEHMDETVHEVFRVQLGIEIAACTPPLAMDNKTNRRHEQTALIGFAGIISGLCEIRLSVPASLAITRAMLPGTAIAEESDWICDAVGELCNLLAGGWKNRLPELGACCSLTIPTVIAGNLYQVHRPANVLVNRRAYIFGDNHHLLLTLVYDPG